MRCIDRIKANPALKLGADAVVGVRGTFGDSVKIQRDGRTVDVIANTDDVDLVNEVVVPRGAAADSYFFQNRQVFCDHETTVQMAVGNLRRWSAFPDSNLFKAWRVQVYVRDTPLGNDILSMVRDGGLGVSIGFIPTDYGVPDEGERKMYGPTVESIVRAWQWLELSFTAFPCNVACRSMASNIDDSKAAVIDRLLTKGVIKRESAMAVGFPVKVGRIIKCRVGGPPGKPVGR